MRLLLLFVLLSIGRKALVPLLEEKYRAEWFRLHKALAFELDLNLKDRRPQRLYFEMLTNSSAVRMRYADGGTVLFSDGRFYLDGVADEKQARADVLAWPYFFAVVFKLRDAGVTVEELDDRRLAGTDYRCAALRFQAGTGETPKDKYQLFVNKNTSRLEAMAYYATYGRARANEAAAIRYGDWQSLGGVPYASAWTFSRWDDARGFGKTFGTARIGQVKWIEEPGTLFDPPPGSR